MKVGQWKYIMHNVWAALEEGMAVIAVKENRNPDESG